MALKRSATLSHRFRAGAGKLRATEMVGSRPAAAVQPEFQEGERAGHGNAKAEQRVATAADERREMSFAGAPEPAVRRPTAVRRKARRSKYR